jgi:hypothetical protein
MHLAKQGAASRLGPARMHIYGFAMLSHLLFNDATTTTISVCIYLKAPNQSNFASNLSLIQFSIST